MLLKKACVILSFYSRAPSSYGYISINDDDFLYNFILRRFIECGKNLTSIFLNQKSKATYIAASVMEELYTHDHSSSHNFTSISDWLACFDLNKYKLIPLPHLQKTNTTKLQSPVEMVLHPIYSGLPVSQIKTVKIIYQELSQKDCTKHNSLVVIEGG